MSVLKYLLILITFLSWQSGLADGKPSLHIELTEDYPDFEEEENGDVKINKRSLDVELNAYLSSCNVTLDMWPDKTINIISPNQGHQYPGSVFCQWEILGVTECLPQISCETLDLRQTDNCDDEYLFISDGVSTGKKFCGPNQGFSHPLKAKFGEYLFVDFRTADSTHFDRLYQGFKCVVRCTVTKKIEPSANLMPDLEPVKEDFTCVCGIPTSDESNRIVNGETSRKSELPWQVALVNSGTRKPFCGGTLINNRYVISAGHCFDGEDAIARSVDVILNGYILDREFKEFFQDVEMGQNGSIRGPGYNLTDDSSDEIQITVEKIIIHRLFSKFVDYDSDIALLRLSTPVDFKKPGAPVPACLPIAEAIGKNLTGQNATVSGWGLAHQNAGATTKILQKLEVPILDATICKALYSSYVISPNMMCAGFVEGERDACQGDSGGPLVSKSDGNQWTQVGVTSWGKGCAKKDRPGVYTIVGNFVPWILHRTKGAKWCRRSKTESKND